MLYFIVNQKSRSGRGAVIWNEVEAALKQKKIDYQAWTTEYEGHAMELAGEICARKEEDICLVAVGGDGTANEVINGMTHFDRVRFGTIPTGSGNDLARGLGITGSPTECLERILACRDKGADACFTMDLGQVRWKGGDAPRLFAISSGIGLDALVCKKALRSQIKDFLNKIHLGRLTYVVLTIQSLFTMKTADAAVGFDRQPPRSYRKNIALAVMNFPAEGGGVPFAPRANATDGRLSACSIFNVSRLRAFFSLPFLVAGRHAWIPGFEITDCAECRIHLKAPMVLHADGEYCADVADAVFTCLPKKLRVLI